MILKIHYLDSFKGAPLKSTPNQNPPKQIQEPLTDWGLGLGETVIVELNKK